MDTAETSVLIGGAVLIAFVLWWFFGARTAVAATASHGVQEISVMVKGGYSPEVIVVQRGAPVRLDFYRDETAACSEQIVFREWGIIRDLPAYQTTAVEFTPEKPGEYTFTCGMNMMRGKLIVQ